MFVNADQVLGPTPFLESLYIKDWKQRIESSDLSLEEINAAYERIKLDKMGTLEFQMSALKSIGFLDVDCVYKNYNFVVLYGKKGE